jgi:hypothetical protein
MGIRCHLRPRRRKAFSPGSKVEPGLKARTKASLSTSARTLLRPMPPAGVVWLLRPLVVDLGYGEGKDERKTEGDRRDRSGMRKRKVPSGGQVKRVRVFWSTKCVQQ